MPALIPQVEKSEKPLCEGHVSRDVASFLAYGSCTSHIGITVRDAKPQTLLRSTETDCPAEQGLQVILCFLKCKKNVRADSYILVQPENPIYVLDNRHMVFLTSCC